MGEEEAIRIFLGYFERISLICVKGWEDVFRRETGRWKRFTARGFNTYELVFFRICWHIIACIIWALAVILHHENVGAVALRSDDGRQSVRQRNLYILEFWL